jgi:hypothetical protein
MAAQDRDRAAAGLLRRSLAQSAGAQGSEADCPAPDILAAYYERSLDSAETARCELHFSQCTRCREQLSAMARADEFSAAREQTPERQAGWVWLWNWRWLAPAAAVIVIAIVWAARHPVPPRTAEQKSPAPLVAMSQPAERPLYPPAQEPLPRAKVAEPGASGAAESNARAKANSSLDVARSAPLQQMPAPTPRKESAENLPLRARNDTQLDALAKADQASKLAAAQGVVAGKAEPNISAGASAPVPSAAPVPPPAAPAPGEKGMMASETVTVEAEGTVNALKTKQTAAPKPEQAKQSAASAMASNYSVLSESVVVKNAEERSAETLIRTSDPNVLWRLTRGGFVESSLDGGATWQGQLPNLNAHLVAGSAPTAKICWLVGRNGIILLTRDGTKWKTIPPPVVADFVAVAARDARSAALTAADGRKFTTADGGKHWTALP